MIKNLLFDLGGVIMDIEKGRCVAAFKELGLPDTDAFFGEFSQQGPFGLLEEGLMGVDEFHQVVKGLIPHPVTDAQIDTAFCKFLIGIPVERLHQLQQLRHNFGIYMLSNTNPIMWEATIADEFRKDGLSVDAYFDGIVTSFRAKAMKPAPKIFEYAEQHLGIKPRETLFLDDSLGNCRASEALGFHSLHVPQGREFYEILKEINLI